jgi:GntR family transcriptional regulator/MocR family aminotransferase
VRASGLTVVPVPVDDGGVRVDRIAALSVQAAIVTPAHQFPLGSTLLPERRAALVRWAREKDALIVEDDYDGELRYDRQPVGALQGLDPERVAYAGTASKSLAPGVRLGWLALPSWLVAPMMAAKRLADRHGSAIEQLALADVLTSGSFDRHVRQRRLEYRRRRDLLTAMLSERVPWFRPVGLSAGLHVLLWLPPDGLSEAEVTARGAERSVGLYQLGQLWHDPAGKPPGLLLGYASLPRHLYPAALAALADTLTSLA